MDVQTIQKILQQQRGENIPCRYSISTDWAFYHVENKHTLYRRKNCMKKFCESLRNTQKI